MSVLDDRQCPHGGLRRACDLCERDVEIASLRTALAEAQRDLDEAQVREALHFDRATAAERRAERLADALRKIENYEVDVIPPRIESTEEWMAFVARAALRGEGGEGG